MGYPELSAYKLKEMIENIDPFCEESVRTAMLQAYMMGHSDGSGKITEAVKEILNRPLPGFKSR